METESETTFTGIEWLKKYCEDLENIKTHSPLLTVLGVSAGIEFLGKLLSTDPIDSGNDCKNKFENALAEFESLNKYQNKNLYGLVRCGLAHRICIKDGVILSPSKDNDLDSDTFILNPSSFLSDFVKAVKTAQSKKDWPNSIATTSYVSVNKDAETGSTPTIKYQE